MNIKLSRTLLVVLLFMLSGCPYNNSKFETVFGKKMHYLDIGDSDKPVILLLHGNPVSSYAYRNVIPHLKDDARVIALDLFNHGLSDKGYPMAYKDHLSAVNQFMEQKEFKDVTLVLHDWGFPLGIGYALEHKDNVKAIAFMETFFIYNSEADLPKEIQLVRSEAGKQLIEEDNIFIEELLFGTLPDLTELDKAIYRAPFEDRNNRKQTYVWPSELPVRGVSEQNLEIYEDIIEFMHDNDVPKLFMYATPGFFVDDNVINYVENNFKNTNIRYVGNGIHWLQESNSDNIGKAVLNWFRNDVIR
jgi:haloalkane dehalogenase